MAVTSLKRQRRRYKGWRIKRELDADLIWERPADWPQLPQVLASESKIVLLAKVEDHDMNHVALTMTAVGGFDVDWGDGTSSINVAAGGTASHTYTYSDAALGSATSEGFKCAVIVCTPHTAGNNFSVVNLQTKNSNFGGNSGLSSPYLEMRMSLPGITLNTNFLVGNGSSVLHRNCRNFEYIGDFGVTNWTNMFVGFIALEQFKGSRSVSTACTNMGSAFSGCIRLRYCPDLDLSNVTSTSAMFSGCTQLRRVPEMNLPACTSINNMFQNCASLEYIPDLTTGTLTSLTSAFSGCASLKRAPAISSTGSVTSWNNLFLNCNLLKYVPTYDTHSATSIAGLFNGCTNLEVVPALDFSAVTTGNTTNLFASCGSLRKILAFGLRFTHTIPSQLSSAALDVYYTNLGTASAQTLTVSGNATATDNPSIATAKGWTVSGS